jgi:hypothetical protein
MTSPIKPFNIPGRVILDGESGYAVNIPLSDQGFRYELSVNPEVYHRILAKRIELGIEIVDFPEAIAKKVPRKKMRWSDIPCPKCHAKNSMSEISYAYLPSQYDEIDIEINLIEHVGGHEPEIACRDCMWRGDKDELKDFWREFQGSDPLAKAPWHVEDLGKGMRARYQRTLSDSFNFDWGGTAGYRYGVDHHTQIHCERCCCTPTEDSGCNSPAAGHFTVGLKSKIPDLHRKWAEASAAFHLSDLVRHP